MSRSVFLFELFLLSRIGVRTSTIIYELNQYIVIACSLLFLIGHNIKHVTVDDDDVRTMTAIKVSKLLSQKCIKESRKLTVFRLVKNDKTNVCAVWPVRIVSTPREQLARLTGGVRCHLLNHVLLSWEL